MSVVPTKLVLVLFLGCVLGVVFALSRPDGRVCSTALTSSSQAAAGLGAGLVTLTSLTMTWVVCCATPSWVVGLAMLGMGVSTALWMEWAGPWLTALGFLFLAASVVVLVRRRTEPKPEFQDRREKEREGAVSV